MTPKLLYLHCALVAFVMFSCNKSGTTDNNTLYHRKFHETQTIQF